MPFSARTPRCFVSGSVNSYPSISLIVSSHRYVVLCCVVDCVQVLLAVRPHPAAFSGSPLFRHEQRVPALQEAWLQARHHLLSLEVRALHPSVCSCAHEVDVAVRVFSCSGRVEVHIIRKPSPNMYTGNYVVMDSEPLQAPPMSNELTAALSADNNRRPSDMNAALSSQHGHDGSSASTSQDGLHRLPAHVPPAPPKPPPPPIPDTHNSMTLAALGSSRRLPQGFGTSGYATREFAFPVGLPSPGDKGFSPLLMVCSVCNACNKMVSPWRPVSRGTLQYSLGKFLELEFYNADIATRDKTCPHSPRDHHIRYFGKQSTLVAFRCAASLC